VLEIFTLSMRTRGLSLLLVISVGCAGLSMAGCSSDDAGASSGAPTPEPAAENPAPTPTGTGTSPIVTPPTPKPNVDDPGPAPPGCGTVTKDKDGFFTRTTAKSPYIGFVPKGYTGQPTTLVVGLHGCGDSAMNFATWGVNPGKTIATQKHIGISIGGRDGQCWDTKTDGDKVLAAIEEVAKEEKLNFVFDKIEDAALLLYAESKFDYTFKVLDRLKRGDK